MAPIMVEEDNSEGTSFTFTPLPSEKTFPSLQKVDVKDNLKKWNLDEFSVAKAFRFDHPFNPDEADAFLLDFFSSPVVQEVAPVCTGPQTRGWSNRTTEPDRSAGWSQLGTLKAGAIKFKRLATTVLRLDFFNRLDEQEIVRMGDISKCLDVPCGEVLVSDRLRKLLLDDGCEDWDLFSAAEREELIFHIMHRLVVGGGGRSVSNAAPLTLSRPPHPAHDEHRPLTFRLQVCVNMRTRWRPTSRRRNCYTRTWSPCIRRALAPFRSDRPHTRSRRPRAAVPASSLGHPRTTFATCRSTRRQGTFASGTLPGSP